MLKDEDPIPVQCDKFNTDPTINTVPYKTPERCNDGMDHQCRNRIGRNLKLKQPNAKI